MPFHVRLPVIRAKDDGVALEELVRAAGRVEQRADGCVAPRERLESRVRALCVRREVVVGEVVDEKVEAVACHEPASDRGRVAVDRSLRTPEHGERRARRIGLEEVVEEEPLRAVGRNGQPGEGRQVRRAPAVARDVDRGSGEARVLERLVEGDCVRPEVQAVEVDDRVEDRATPSRPRAPRRTTSRTRRAVSARGRTRRGAGCDGRRDVHRSRSTTGTPASATGRSTARGRTGPARRETRARGSGRPRLLLRTSTASARR